MAHTAPYRKRRASSPAEHMEHHCVPSTTLYTDERLLHTTGRCPGGLRQEDDYIVSSRTVWAIE